jgi:hypothetical protein
MTEHFTFDGEARWLKVFEPDQYQDGPKRYVVNLLVDEENHDNFLDSGIRTRVREEEGKYLLKFVRDHDAKELTSGDKIGGGRPNIVDADGEKWTKGVIGNGSKIRVSVSVYDTKMGKGHRLNSIKVLEHVPFDDDRREREEEPSSAEKPKKGLPF